MTQEQRVALRAKAEMATPGPWHHVQARQTVPAVRTVHGPVPAQRVDYVSTWPALGSPKGHRVVIDMPGRESRVSSNDMAFIAAANPAAVLALLAALDAAEAERDAARTAHETQARETLKSLQHAWAERDAARAALAAAEARAVVPAGWKMVPVEPTQAMLAAAGAVDDRAYATGSQHGADDEQIYYAMTEASPPPPGAGDGA